MKTYYIYIVTNKSNTLYIGVTNNLQRRMYEHKNKLIKGFTYKYNINKLVYYEETTSIYDALNREKQLKNYSRKNKIKVIKSINPKFEDLIIKYDLLESSSQTS